MAYNRKHAQTLCNRTEFQLFESSLKGAIEKLPQARVQEGIQRARTLRQKYRDLHQRQRLATRDRTGSKKGAKPATNERTEQKIKLFAEVLERFELRLKTLKLAAKATATQKAGTQKVGTQKAATKKVGTRKALTQKTAAQTTVAKKTVAKKTAAKKTVAKKTATQKTPAKKAGTRKTAIKKTAVRKTTSKKVGASKAAAKKGTPQGSAAMAPGLMSEQASVSGERQRQQNTRGKAVKGHQRASTQRTQAKRDGGKKR